jgi:nuclear transport factor 2 (NTF2) superfamily protein
MNRLSRIDIYRDAKISRLFQDNKTKRDFEMRLNKLVAMVLMFAGLLMSATSFADILPIKPFCIENECTHPDIPPSFGFEGANPDRDAIILDIRGSAKKVDVASQYNKMTYLINKVGLVTKKMNGATTINFVYDDKHRLLKEIFSENKLGEYQLDEYSYLDDKNMIIHTRYARGEWENSDALVKSNDTNGDTNFYLLNADTTGVGGTKNALSQNKSKFDIERLGGGSSFNPKNKSEAETFLLAALNCLNGNGCSNGFKLFDLSVQYLKSKEGELDKYSYTHFMNGQIVSSTSTINTVTWFKNGLIAEEAGMYDQLADGTFPHGIYKYEFDSHGNWIKRDKYINDIPATITDNKPKYRKVEKATVTRKIEYYN